VARVDGDDDGSLLAAAVAEHVANLDLWSSSRSIDAREDSVGADGVSTDGGSPLGRIDQLRAARVPMWLWSGWYDGAYAAAALAQLADPLLDARVTIGPYPHGGAHSAGCDPFLPDEVVETPAEQHSMMSAFLRHRLTGAGVDPSPDRLRYYTFGRGWQTSSSWPPAAATATVLGLDASGTLNVGRHESPAADQWRTHDVDHAVSSGPAGTRWHSLIGGAFVEDVDRSGADARSCSWDSDPLDAAWEISGNPVAHVDLTTTATDGALHVYLAAVSADGRSRCLTEGSLRLLHRAESTPPYETFGPWHSCRRADAQPVEPGELLRVAITLWPISVEVPAGHRLRFVLAGADTPLFRRIPSDGPVQLAVRSTSHLVIPRVPRPTFLV
jgi:putative CocE/NonD family hydrolase